MSILSFISLVYYQTFKYFLWRSATFYAHNNLGVTNNIYVMRYVQDNDSAFSAITLPAQLYVNMTTIVH